MGISLAWQVASLDATKRVGTVAGVGAFAYALDARYWLTIAAGLAIGMMARWAVMLSLDHKVGWREIRIDALVILANGLLAAQFAELMGLHSVKLMVAASMFGASSTSIFSAVHKKFVEKASTAAVIFTGSNTVTDVPAVAPHVTVHSIGKDGPQTPAEVAVETLRRVPEPTTQFDALLDQIDRRGKPK